MTRKQELLDRLRELDPEIAAAWGRKRGRPKGTTKPKGEPKKRIPKPRVIIVPKGGMTPRHKAEAILAWVDYFERCHAHETKYWSRMAPARGVAVCAEPMGRMRIQREDFAEEHYSLRVRYPGLDPASVREQWLRHRLLQEFGEDITERVRRMRERAKRLVRRYPGRDPMELYLWVRSKEVDG